MTVNIIQIVSDHVAPRITTEDAFFRVNDPKYATTFARQALRYGWRDGVRWLLTQQQEWHTLPTRDAIHELQKGTGSIYHPIFNDGTPGNPAIWCDCPTCGRTTTDSEGLCHTCGYDHLA